MDLPPNDEIIQGIFISFPAPVVNRKPDCAYWGVSNIPNPRALTCKPIFIPDGIDMIQLTLTEITEN